MSHEVPSHRLCLETGLLSCGDEPPSPTLTQPASRPPATHPDRTAPSSVQDPLLATKPSDGVFVCQVTLTCVTAPAPPLPSASRP